MPPSAALHPGHFPTNVPSQPTLVCLTFKLHGDAEEFSAMLTGKLSLTSTMKDAMEEHDIADNLLIFDIDTNGKILIKKKNGSYYTFKYDCFYSMTANELVSIQNIDDDYVIEIKNRGRRD